MPCLPMPMSPNRMAAMQISSTDTSARPYDRYHRVDDVHDSMVPGSMGGEQGAAETLTLSTRRPLAAPLKGDGTTFHGSQPLGQPSNRLIDEQLDFVNRHLLCTHPADPHPSSLRLGKAPGRGRNIL